MLENDLSKLKPTLLVNQSPHQLKSIIEEAPHYQSQTKNYINNNNPKRARYDSAYFAVSCYNWLTKIISLKMI